MNDYAPTVLFVAASVAFLATTLRRPRVADAASKPKEKIKKPIVEKQALPALLTQAVLVPSDETPSGAVVVGHDFDVSPNPSAKELALSYKTSGFQATNLGLAIDEINRMRNFKAYNEETDEVVECTYTP